MIELILFGELKLPEDFFRPKNDKDLWVLF